MSSIIFLLIIKFILTSLISDVDDLYKKALCEMEKTEEFDALIKENNGYSVSNEILSFNTLGLFYKEDLGISANQIFTKDKLIVSNHLLLLKLSTRKHSNLKVFFTEVKDDIFFCEVFETNARKLKYEELAIFGISYIYMFKIKGNGIKLLHVKALSNN